MFGIIKKTNEVLVISENGEDNKAHSRNTDFALSSSDNVPYSFFFWKKKILGCL